MPNTEEIRIAIVDDDEDDYFIISDYISEIEGRKFVIDWYRDYNAALEKIKARAYHIYFVDYRLGNETGLELLQDAVRNGCDDPFVLLTGKGSKSIDIMAMQSGATDYLVKSELNTEKLERCIRYSLDRAVFVRELKARENKYRNLFEKSNDALFIANEGLQFLELNQAASQLAGCTMSELAQRRLYDFLRDENQCRGIRELIRRGENIDELEVKIETDQKETRICLLSLTFLNNADAQPLLHGILHDITNLRKAETLNIQAEKLAANERLIRMLAHEIRNPLNNISLSTENLQLAYHDEEKRKNLFSILQRNSVRINQIITELLNLTKPLELVFKEYPLQEIITESLANAADRLDLQKIKVSTSFPEQPLPITADKTKLTIAFSNILINAIEAMEIGKGELQVQLSDTGRSYRVSIRDNGHGISDEYLNKLFEPFFTLKKNGMGLGLAATYSIIQSHKGSIQVESSVGHGSNFIINFKNDPALQTA
jgi:two-component system, sporulation sensor kinase E